MTVLHNEHFRARLRRYRPAYRFQGEWVQQPLEWQRRWREHLVALLGDWPPRCPPRPHWQQLERRQHYTLHQVRYTTEPGLETVALVAVPLRRAGPLPGVLALHGHGPLGPDPVMVWGSDARLAEQVRQYRYDYGHRLAECGMVVFAPALRGFGMRLTPAERAAAEAGQDTCNVNFFQQAAFGEVALTGQLHDLRVALDLLAAMPEVDPERLGCAGLSYGGRLATYLTPLEPRLKAVVLAGVMNSYIERIETYAWCGYQVVPGILRYADNAEVMGLIAPRPLAVELGSHDGCAPLRRGLAEFARLRRVYRALEAAAELRLIRFDGGHIFHGDEAIPWLTRQLSGAARAPEANDDPAPQIRRHDRERHRDLM